MLMVFLPQKMKKFLIEDFIFDEIKITVIVPMIPKI